jgi:hypothetical protein
MQAIKSGKRTGDNDSGHEPLGFFARVNESRRTGQQPPCYSNIAGLVLMRWRAVHESQCPKRSLGTTASSG